MDRFDPLLRVRIVRIVAVLATLVIVSLLIGLSVGRPFDGPATAGQPTTEPSAVPTLPPTPTPSATPIPTPASSPTPLSSDGWLIRSQETFDSVSSWPAQQQQGWGSGYEDGRYWLKLDGQQTVSYRIPLDAAEFRITVDVQVKGGYAGLLFLSTASDALYRFQIDNTGRYRLARRLGSNISPLIDWTSANALKPGPDAFNQLEVRRVEDKIILFANDTQLADYSLPDDAQLQAIVGMTLDAITPDSMSMAYFDNLVVRVPEVPAAP